MPRLVMFLMVLAVSVWGQSPGTFTFPQSQYTSVTGTVTFQWVASTYSTNYYVQFGTSASGCTSATTGPNNVSQGWYGPSPSATVAIPNVSGYFTATLWYYNSGGTQVTTCQSWPILYVAGAYITGPVSGQTISAPSQTFNVSNGNPYTITAGWSAMGSSEIWNNVSQSGTSFTLTGIPYSNQHAQTFVRITQGGVSYNYTYSNPVNPELVTVHWVGSYNPGLTDWTNLPGTGAYNQFEPQLSDSLGESKVTFIYLWVQPISGATAVGCMMGYRVADNAYALLGDDGATWGTWKARNSHSTLSNSQCSLSSDSARVGTVGSPYNVSLADFPVTFNIPAYTGVHTVLVLGLGTAAGSQTNGGWQNVGTWTVPSGQLTSQVVVNTNQANDDYTGDVTTIATSPAAMARFVRNQRAVRTPTSMRVRLSNGRIFDAPRMDQMDYGSFRYTVEQIGGTWKYTYRMDNSGIQIFSVGEASGIPQPIDRTQPDGWAGGAKEWFAMDGAARSTDASYSVTHTWSPGLMRVYMQSPEPDYSIPGTYELTPADDQAVIQATGIYSNSAQRLAIGPAFAPGVSRETVLAKVRSWVDDYGYSFLSSVAAAEWDGDLSKLQPETELDQQVIDGLRFVLKGGAK